MHGFGLGHGHPWLNPEGTFRVFCKADEGLCLAVRGGALVLAAADPSDDHQHWFKDVRFSLRIKDEEDQPVFSLINKATGLAVQHSLGPYHPVRLLKFNPEDFDESVLWTESAHLGRDFGRIRMMHDVALGLDALPRDVDAGGVRDGTAITLTEWAEGDTQSWKIIYWSDKANKTFGGLYTEPTCRIYCKADEDFSLTVRDGAVCLAPTDPDDEYQHWIQDKKPGNRIKDMEGYPTFALVNLTTGDAISVSSISQDIPISSPLSIYHTHDLVDWYAKLTDYEAPFFKSSILKPCVIKSQRSQMQVSNCFQTLPTFLSIPPRPAPISKLAASHLGQYV